MTNEELRARIVSMPLPELPHKDAHVATAMDIFQVPADQVTPEMRRYAKTINYAHWYSPFETFNETFSRIGKGIA